MLSERVKTSVRNLFSEREIVLCTYIAKFGEEPPITIAEVARIGGRSVASVKLKVENIVSMLDETASPGPRAFPALTGKPPGMQGRRTNWKWVGELAMLSKDQLRARCTECL
jgi:hypothetical protein